jgi:FAD/FMN-containing dehydrogenase
MAKRSGAIHVIVFGEDQVPGTFGCKREFVPIALESSPATTIIKMGLLPTRMKEILTAASEIADRNALPWATLARGVGVVYLVLLPGEYSEEMRRRVVLATEQICAACAGLGGNATIPWCPSEWKGTLRVWGIDRGDSAQMRKVKSVFDPHGILAPGRLIGGL